MIERRNILELIGNHRGKYHSCVLTTYSLDFSFFEERVLPSLRSANIKNVNVLADGHFLELAQENTTGKEFKHNKTYNFHPVYQKGVFHPKIMLLTGTKHGLLIIGSGNITSSGLSTNDEIWGAFHLDNLGNENAPLFYEVWNYLQRFLGESKGFVSQKIDWITKYSPWLNDLPKPKAKIKLDSINQSVQFVGNTPDQSIYDQIKAAIPLSGVKELTIISPYYNKNGVIIKRLQEDYKPKTFRCILDINFGLLPLDLDSNTSEKISFYEWGSCKNDYNKDYNRLHAKMIHFSYDDGIEYLLLGSANATDAGLGDIGLIASNAEAGLIINRKSSSSWLKHLKIKIPSNTIQLDKIETPVGIDYDSIPRPKRQYRILYSELRGNEVTIFLNQVVQGELLVGILNREGILVFEGRGKSEGDNFTVVVKDIDEAFKLFLHDDSGNNISNYSIIHRFESLVRCNPDPNQEKLDALLEDEYPDGEGVTILLQYIDYNWADEEDLSIKQIVDRAVPIKKSKVNEDEKKEYEKLSADEFNKVSNEILLKQSGELSNASVKIAEFLNLVTSGELRRYGIFKESDEQKLLEDEEQKGEGSDVQTSIRSKSNAKREQQAVARYFSNLEKIYNEQLKVFFETKAVTESPNGKIDIRSLSNILIGLQLIQIYQGKKYTGSSDKDDSSTLREELYLIDGNLSNDTKSVKGFLINVLGKFLLLSTAGMKVYEYDILNHKLSQSLQQVMIKSIFVILNLYWRESEEKYRKTLLLNTLYFLNPGPKVDDNFCRDLISKLKEYKHNARYINSNFQENLSSFSAGLLEQYCSWLNKFNDIDQRKKYLVTDIRSLWTDSILFKSKIGFNHLLKATELDPFTVDLAREGYPSNDGEFLLERVSIGNKCIKF